MAFCGALNIFQRRQRSAIVRENARREIAITDLPAEVQTTPETTEMPFVDFPESGLDLPAYLAQIERELIQRSLERTGGNRNRAAELLRIKRTTLVEKLKRLSAD